MRKILVVGGTGFIGHHLLRQAKLRGWKVNSLSLNSPSSEKMIEGVEYLCADIESQKSLNATIGGSSFDYIVNLSGYINHAPFSEGGDAVIRQHFLGVANLISVIDRGRLRKFIQIGSSDEYGCIGAPQKEFDAGRPVTPYAFGKVAATQFLQMLHRVESLPVTILRLFLTYGPGQDSQRFIPQLVKGCLEDLEFPVSEGNQVRDFCYVEDVVSGIFLAFEETRCEGEVVNLASGIPIKIRDVISIVQRLTGKGRPMVAAIPYRKNEPMELYADISKAKNLLRWSPLTSLEEGLLKTVAAEAPTNI